VRREGIPRRAGKVSSTKGGNHVTGHKLASARSALVSALVLLAVLGPTRSQAASITNGGFELGNLSGWTVSDTGSGTWNVHTGDFSGRASAQPPEGLYAATTNQGGPGSHLLMQTLALEAGATHDLTMTAYYKAFAALVTPSPDSLSEVGPANQQYRIEILRAGAPVRSVAAADILHSLFRTKAGDPAIMLPRVLAADLTQEAGSSVILRIAEVDNQGHFYASVDAVVLVSREIDTTLDSVPPPLTNATDAMFDFSSTHPDTTGFECSIDGDAFGECAAPVEVGSVSEGVHEFRVRAIARTRNS